MSCRSRILALPPVRPKKIAPLKAAERVSAHTKAPEPHTLFCFFNSPGLFNMSLETQTLAIS